MEDHREAGDDVEGGMARQEDPKEVAKKGNWAEQLSEPLYIQTRILSDSCVILPIASGFAELDE